MTRDFVLLRREVNDGDSLLQGNNFVKWSLLPTDSPFRSSTRPKSAAPMTLKLTLFSRETIIQFRNGSRAWNFKTTVFGQLSYKNDTVIDTLLFVQHNQLELVPGLSTQVNISGFSYSFSKYHRLSARFTIFISNFIIISYRMYSVLWYI